MGWVSVNVCVCECVIAKHFLSLVFKRLLHHLLQMDERCWIASLTESWLPVISNTFNLHFAKTMAFITFSVLRILFLVALLSPRCHFIVDIIFPWLFEWINDQRHWQRFYPNSFFTCLGWHRALFHLQQNRKKNVGENKFLMNLDGEEKKSEYETTVNKDSVEKENCT